jgi:hypothetical protein
MLQNAGEFPVRLQSQRQTNVVSTSKNLNKRKREEKG